MLLAGRLGRAKNRMPVRLKSNSALPLNALAPLPLPRHHEFCPSRPRTPLVHPQPLRQRHKTHGLLVVPNPRQGLSFPPCPPVLSLNFSSPPLLPFEKSSLHTVQTETETETCFSPCSTQKLQRIRLVSSIIFCVTLV
jgi:hypothetical protein